MKALTEREQEIEKAQSLRDDGYTIPEIVRRITRGETFVKNNTTPKEGYARKGGYSLEYKMRVIKCLDEGGLEAVRREFPNLHHSNAYIWRQRFGDKKLVEKSEHSFYVTDDAALPECIMAAGGLR